MGTNKNSSSRTRTLLNCRLSRSSSLSLFISPLACANSRGRVPRGECGASRCIIETVDVMEEAETRASAEREGRRVKREEGRRGQGSVVEFRAVSINLLLARG